MSVRVSHIIGIYRYLDTIDGFPIIIPIAVAITTIINHYYY